MSFNRFHLIRALSLVVITTSAFSSILKNSQPHSPKTAVQPPPLFELGLLAGGGLVPHYPGSVQSDFRPVLAPYFIYRGRFLRKDDVEGARIQVLKKFGLKLDIGFFGAYRLESENNRARRGMPDIGWLAAAGPRLVAPFEMTNQWVVRFFLPLRVNFEIPHFPENLDWPTCRGLDFPPAISVEKKDFIKPEGKWFTSLWLNWVTEQFSDMYYEVKPQYARINSNRPAYDARSGFFGTHFFTGVNYPFTQNLKLFSLVSYSNFTGAVNQSSPLHRSDHSLGVLIGLNWIFYRSKTVGAN